MKLALLTIFSTTLLLSGFASSNKTPAHNEHAHHHGQDGHKTEHEHHHGKADGDWNK